MSDLTLLRAKAVSLVKAIQNQVCAEINTIDPTIKNQCDVWERKDPVVGNGGGGETRIFRGGSIFEQAGVNFSQVHGVLPRLMTNKLLSKNKEVPFYATGVSLVLHPFSPMIPTVHANFRFLAVENSAWFGGGADLTPYVIDEEDSVHFHSTLKEGCALGGKDYYPLFKKQCDEYFFIKHRNECRGIGGVFFDYLGKDQPAELSSYFELTESIASRFCEAYFPIVRKNRKLEWTNRQKKFQLLRRGRYVEFNLVYDKGTQFGLETGGRTESILMSLPPEVNWQYENDLAENNEEKLLMEVLHSPKEWV